MRKTVGSPRAPPSCVELYSASPPSQWPRKPDGELAMFTKALDLEALLRETPHQKS